MDGTTNIKASVILGKIYRDFKIDDTGIKADVIQWVADCLAEIGTPEVLAPANVTRIAEDGKVLMPCGLDLLEGVEYNKCMLDRVDRLIKREYSGELNTVYRINYPYIKVDVKDGEEITIHYKTYPLDEDGYPMIPNLASVRKAVQWYIITMLLQGNYKHPVINYEFALNRYENELKGEATNDLLLVSPDEYGRILDRQRTPFVDFDTKLRINESANY